MIPTDWKLALEDALERLTEKQRWALLLVCYLGYTQEEAGEMCGVEQAAISRRIERATEAMRGYLSA